MKDLRSSLLVIAGLFCASWYLAGSEFPSYLRLAGQSLGRMVVAFSFILVFLIATLIGRGLGSK